VIFKQDTLDLLETHWAVTAIPQADRTRAMELAAARLVQKTVGHQLNLSAQVSAAEEDLFQRMALAYEMAAIEGLPAFIRQSPEQDALRKQCAAGAWRAFAFRRLSPVPQATANRLFHVLHLASQAYCGDRWSDIRRWFVENPAAIETPSVAEQPWDRRLLYRLFDCWVRLLRKNGWDDLDRIRETIAGLREDQREFERGSFSNESNSQDRAMALRLVALYNWARATELLGRYMLQGEPRGIHALLDKHFEAATEAGMLAGDATLEMLMRWLQATSRQMVANSLWWVAHAINSRVTRFVGSVTQHQSMFELLPPQRAALQEQGLLDAAATAVVIDLPTSGGKTLLAQFRILQALNQFADRGGWVAYVVPTKALSNQIARRLRRDFSPIDVRVEQLTGALEIDAIEQELLASTATREDRAFDVLVATPEKLQLVIRNKKITRPLALVVMDEAHNLENDTRGLRIELLLATIKQECSGANFLLLMPFVDRVDALARWLADGPHAGRSISFGTSPWRPNEQIVGMFRAQRDETIRAGWRMEFETLLTTRKTIQLRGTHRVNGAKPLPHVPRSTFIKADGSQSGMNLQAAAMASVFASRGTSIAVGDSPSSAWSMAREVSKARPVTEVIPDRVQLVQRFLASEISPQFELIDMLGRGIGVHHAGLSDEVRSLVEWLTEEGEIKVLCATTTLAQGINFPVSSVFLATTEIRLRSHPYRRPMGTREFWNLAGRAGRMNQESVGVVGIAEANRPDAIRRYVKDAAGDLASRLVTIVAELDHANDGIALLGVLHQEQWEDFRCYVNHLVNEIRDLDRVISTVEDSLRNTYGYRVLQETPEGQLRARKLVDATKLYASKIAQNPGCVAQADSTGFSFEGVTQAMIGIGQLERKLTPADFSAERLFGEAGSMADFYGVMLRIPQLARQLNEITPSGIEHQHLAGITRDWVNGKSIQEIAQTYFRADQDATRAITDACKAIYRNLTNNGTWGLSALSRLSGMDFDRLSDAQKRQINLLPAMIYHGVRSEEAVLMRMNGVPRSLAENIGMSFRTTSGTQPTLQSARSFLTAADVEVWNRAKPVEAQLSGGEYKSIWQILSGSG
jgi:replicative superfamily II helicase